MDPDLHSEIESHIQIETDRLIAQGMPAAEAHAAARRAFGNPTATLEVCFEQSRWMPLERLAQDLRYALRGMRRSPGFTAVALLLLALGIGANTAMFSVMDAVLLKTLPIRDPEGLYLVMPELQGRRDTMSYPVYRDLRDPQRSFSGLFASGGDPTLYRVRFPGDRYAAPPKVTVGMAGGEYFDVLGVEPALGRFFSAEHDQTLGAHPVVVLSHDFWRRQLHSDPAAVGSSILLNDTAFTILGVAARGFFGDAVGQRIDLWTPLAMQTVISMDATQNRDWNWLKMFGRLQPGVTREAAEAELTTLFRESMRKLPTPLRSLDSWKVRLTPAAKGWDEFARSIGKPLQLLMGMVALVLLIACANVANLLLARGAARRREMGVRLALGCGRARLVRQLLTESLLLAAIGGLLGLFVAQWGIGFLQLLLANGQEPRHVLVELDWRILAFTAAVTAVTGVLFGIAPAFRASATPVVASLQAGGSRTVTGGRMWLSRALVVTQVVFSLVVLVSAGLLVRSLRNLQAVDTGFDRAQTLVFEVNEFFNRNKELTPDRLRVLQESLESIPGVRSASLSAFGLMSGIAFNTEVSHADMPPDAKPVRLRHNPVSPGYFRSVGTRILYGREFTPADAGPSARVVVISESAARKLFGNQPPLGKLICRNSKFKPEDALTVIGIAADARHDSIRGNTAPMIYPPLFRYGGNFLSAEFRIAAPVAMVAPAIRQVLEREKVLVREVRTLEEQADLTIAMERTLALLASVFGALALIVAAAGLYGLLAYATARRTAEIGVRMAFGARRSQILRQVIGEAARLAVIGIVVGLPIAIAAASLTRTMLFGLEPGDPSTIAATAAVLLAAALAAGLIPAWRASRVDPSAALRHE